MRFIPILAAGTAALALGACNISANAEDDVGAAQPSGGTATARTYDLSGFDSIALMGSDAVIVTRGDTFAVTASGDAETLDQLVLRVRNGSLEVRRRSGMHWGGGNSRHITVRVTMPELSGVSVAGSGDFTANRLGGERASISVAGSGDVTLTGVEAGALDISLAGSGNVTATGAATSADVSVAGSGDVASPQLSLTTADISVAGSGNVLMRVTGTADVSSIGSGDVVLTGGARCSTSQVGSGSTDCS